MDRGYLRLVVLALLREFCEINRLTPFPGEERMKIERTLRTSLCLTLVFLDVGKGYDHLETFFFVRVQYLLSSI